MLPGSSNTTVPWNVTTTNTTILTLSLPVLLFFFEGGSYIFFFFLFFFCSLVLCLANKGSAWRLSFSGTNEQLRPLGFLFYFNLLSFFSIERSEDATKYNSTEIKFYTSGISSSKQATSRIYCLHTGKALNGNSLQCLGVSYKRETPCPCQCSNPRPPGPSWIGDQRPKHDTTGSVLFNIFHTAKEEATLLQNCNNHSQTKNSYSQWLLLCRMLLCIVMHQKLHGKKRANDAFKATYWWMREVGKIGVSFLEGDRCRFLGRNSSGMETDCNKIK
jgi:hypothetical protein